MSACSTSGWEPFEGGETMRSMRSSPGLPTFLAIVSSMFLAQVGQAYATCSVVKGQLANGKSFHGAQCKAIAVCNCAATMCSTLTPSPKPGAPPFAKISYSNATCTAVIQTQIQTIPTIPAKPRLQATVSQNFQGYDISFNGTGFTGQSVGMCLAGLIGRTVPLKTGIVSSVSSAGAIQGDVVETCHSTQPVNATLQATYSGCNSIITSVPVSLPCSN